MLEQSKHFDNYNQGLNFLLGWFRDNAPHGLLGLIINGSGINVGKTTLAVDVRRESGLNWDQVLNFEHSHPSDYDPVPTYPANVRLGIMQSEIKGVRHLSGEIMKKQMKEELEQRFVRVLSRGASGLLMVNIESLTVRFPADAVMADVWILNELARTK